MNYLISTTEVYRVDSENDAANLIKEAKQDGRFIVQKSSTEYKIVKEKGEIVEEFWKVTLQKVFTDLKNPDCRATVEYDVDSMNFPEPDFEDEVTEEEKAEVDF